MLKYKKEDLEQLTAIFNALSNPNRLKMFLFLYKHHSYDEYEASASDARSCLAQMGDELGLVPSSISHHLKELRVANLISMERRGKRVACSINHDTILKFQDFFKEL